MGQHVAGNGDFIVPCQMLHDFRRREVDRRQPLAEFGPGAAFDPGDQQAQHIVEDLDLFLVEARAVMRKRLVTCRSVSTRSAGEPVLTASSSSAMME